MFYKEENSFNTFARPREYTQCILVSNIEHYFGLFTTPHGPFNVGLLIKHYNNLSLN